MRILHLLLGALTAAVLASGLCVAGCAPAGSRPVELDQNASGTVQQLVVGQEISIALKSNPTTGYQWAVDGSVPSQLEQVGEARYSAESTLVGAGGQQVWTFRAKATGSGLLKLKYWRSFEPTAPPAETFSVTVRVQ